MIAGIGWRRVREWVGKGALVAAIAGAIVAPWFVFLWRTYGNLSGLEQIAQIQWWNYYGVSKPSIADLLFNRGFAAMRFRETWGEFGWRDIPLSTGLLWAIGAPLVVALGGLVQYAATTRPGPLSPFADPVVHPARWQFVALGVMAATVAIAYFAVVQFGTRFQLTQARYYFPAVNAAALLLMLGLRSVTPRSAHAYGQGAVFASLVLLNVLIFTQYVIPHYRAT